MPHRIMRLIALLLLAAPAWASAASAPPPPDVTTAPPSGEDDKLAQADWETFKAALSEKYPGDMAHVKPSAYYAWFDAQQKKIRDLGVKFFDSYPAVTELHWDTALVLLGTNPLFIGQFKPGFDAQPSKDGIVVDLPARAEWKKRQREIAEMLRGASDAGRGEHEKAEEFLVETDTEEFADTGASGGGAALQARMDHFMDWYPKSAQIEDMEGSLLDAVAAKDPGSLGGILGKLASASNPAVRALAAGRMKWVDARKAPMAMAFTAADGRTVDLAQLRGKVVLVQFWGRASGPCRAELPFLASAYGKYRDSGFEIVGISVEKAGFAPTDTPDALATKLSEAKRGFLIYAESHGISWPQYFDGKGWGNPYVSDLTIDKIPTSFLLDKSGLLVSTDVRGPDLDDAVKKCLGL